MRVEVLVVPRARAAHCARDGDRLRVRVTAAPEGGEANRQVVAAVAGWLGVAPGAVEILRGHRGRRKWLWVPVDRLPPGPGAPP